MSRYPQRQCEHCGQSMTAQTLPQHLERTHGPLVCDCNHPAPIPWGFGECTFCHRVMLAYLWRDGHRDLP